MVLTLLPLASIGHIAGLMLAWMAVLCLFAVYLLCSEKVRGGRLAGARKAIEAADNALRKLRSESGTRYFSLAIMWRLDFAERNLKQLSARVGRAGNDELVEIAEGAKALCDELADCAQHVPTRDEMLADQGTIRMQLADAPAEFASELRKAQERFAEEDRARAAYRENILNAIHQRWDARRDSLEASQEILARELGQ
jgi:hypothetical protein